jgi:predicted nucleic acid-binding protein
MAEANNSLHLAKLRSRLHRAAITIALQRAQWAVKAQLQRQGLRLSSIRVCELRTVAEAHLAEHREELIPDVKALVERWRQEGFFGKRAARAFI